MIYLLILYFIFLVAYVAFNVYAAIKVWSMRQKNDSTQTVLIVYLFTIGIIILISLILIAGLKWPGFSKLI